MNADVTVKAASAAGYAAGNVNIIEAQLAWTLGPQENTKGNALGQLFIILFIELKNKISVKAVPYDDVGDTS